MNIALLTDGIHPYVIGGMQKHSFYLARYFAAAGHRVDLYHTNQSTYDIRQLEFFTAAEKENIRSFVIEFPRKGKSPGHYIRESYEYSKRIFRQFKQNEMPDFVYAKGFTAWEMLHQKSKGFKLPPIGVNFHGYEMFQRAPSFYVGLQNRFLLRAPLKYNITQADYLFSYGGKITEILRGLSVPEKKIIEIPTGIGSEWINDKPRASLSPRKLIFVGRYERRKGLPELMTVLKTLMRGSRDFECHFVGDIPHVKRVASPKLKYYGAVSDPKEMRTTLRNMDILVCPSHSEGMPNVIMEAMASGLAVIGTDVGAVSLMVSPSTGWLIPPANTAALKKAITAALDLPSAELDKMKRQAVAHVQENFLWEKIAAQTIETIAQIAKPNR